MFNTSWILKRISRIWFSQTICVFVSLIWRYIYFCPNRFHMNKSCVQIMGCERVPSVRSYFFSSFTYYLLCELIWNSLIYGRGGERLVMRQEDIMADGQGDHSFLHFSVPHEFLLANKHPAIQTIITLLSSMRAWGMYVRWVFCGWLWMNCLMIVEKHPKWSTALLTPIMRYIPFLCVHHHTLARICRRSTHLWVTYNTHSSCCDKLNDRMKEKKTHTLPA